MKHSQIYTENRVGIQKHLEQMYKHMENPAFGSASILETLLETINKISNDSNYEKNAITIIEDFCEQYQSSNIISSVTTAAISEIREDKSIQLSDNEEFKAALSGVIDDSDNL